MTEMGLPLVLLVGGWTWGMERGRLIRWSTGIEGTSITVFSSLTSLPELDPLSVVYGKGS